MLEVLGLLVAFIGIFLLRARDIPFYTAIILATFIIGLTSGESVTILFDVLLNTLSVYNTWNLVFAVSMISVLGYVLKETGLMVRFIEGLSKVLPGNIMLVIIPAVFGFLSMPGGALMSAPFIESDANKLGLDNEAKTYYNVWFRHILYWVNPINSSTIMATTLSGIAMNTWLKAQSPLFFVMTAIGFISSRGFIKSAKKIGRISDLNFESIKGVVPILVTVGITLLGVPIWGSLISGIIIALLLGDVKPRRWFNMFKNGLRWELIVTIISMLYLRDMIDSTGSVSKLFFLVLELGVPVIVITIFIPMFIGAISGSPAMGIGIAFPILLPLLGESNIHLTSIVFLGIICTYITSPLHLCLVLTNNYFKSDLYKVIRILASSSFMLYLVGLAYHLFFYLF
jgi:integral membrane protein (TIGR00529 family)